MTRKRKSLNIALYVVLSGESSVGKTEDYRKNYCCLTTVRVNE